MSNGGGNGESPGIGTRDTPTRSHTSLRLYIESQFKLLPQGLRRSQTNREGLRRIARQKGHRL